MSNLIFFAIMYGIYLLWQALTGESSEWQNYTYQDSRAFRVRESVKNGKPYEETPFEKKMHARYGYKYDPWYQKWIETGEFKYPEASQWIYDHYFWK